MRRFFLFFFFLTGILLCAEPADEMPESYNDQEKGTPEDDGSNQSDEVPDLPESGIMVFKVTGTNVKFSLVKIEAGSFLMGTPLGEHGRRNDERRHQVTISQDFWIGQHEVTQKLWKQIMGSTVRSQRDVINPDWPLWGVGEDFPMYYVSWNEAMAFCKRLNEMSTKSRPQGYRFDLPTEAQWEYACRAGTTTRYYCGKDLLPECAWTNENSKNSVHPVGKTVPNNWKIYDMHGNVWEWCRDCYIKPYPKETTDPCGNRGSTRVYRGGSWHDSAAGCRAAYRKSFLPADRGAHIGLRIVLVKDN